MFKIQILFFLFFVSYNLFSQNNDVCWLFGNNAYIKFENNVPKNISGSTLSTLEGSASVSNEKGELLFYTDGVTVWNKNNSIMKNGIGLLGHRSATQSAVILQNPKDKNIFYLFTIGEKVDQNGLNYHLIDLNKNNGLGEVVFKNKKVLGQVTEKLTATIHQNKNSYWIVCHQWNTSNIYSYLLSDIGIEDVVISNTGPKIFDSNNDQLNNEAIGYSTFSQNGNLIAMAYTANNEGKIDIYSFNNNTGNATFIKTITTLPHVYGVEFSPNNQFLYCSFDRGNTAIKQFDVNTSQETFQTISDGNQYGALRLAPNNKIYIVKSGYQLDVIEEPNLKGNACSYNKNAFTLQNSTNGFGLPNANLFISKQTNNSETNKNITSKTNTTPAKETSISKQNSTVIKLCKELKPNLGNDTNVCGEKLLLKSNINATHYLWSNGDTSSQIKINNTGYYWLKCSNNACENSDTIFVKFTYRSPNFKYLPEFNPNNHGVNDKMQYTIYDVEYFNLKVYNKNNKLVFETYNPKEVWNGKKGDKPYPAGEYHFEVTYKSLCPNSKEVNEKGIVKIVK